MASNSGETSRLSLEKLRSGMSRIVATDW